MDKRSAKRPELSVSEVRLKGKRRGALLKEEIWTLNGEVVKYNLVYINPMQCARDNGRVLGYDSSHGHHHRHFMGTVEPIEFQAFEKLLLRFQAEVEEIWRKEDEQKY